MRNYLNIIGQGMRKELKNRREGEALPCSQCRAVVHNGWHLIPSADVPVWKRTDEIPSLCLRYPKYCDSCKEAR